MTTILFLKHRQIPVVRGWREVVSLPQETEKQQQQQKAGS
jgi:hypothetical protein